MDLSTWSQAAFDRVCFIQSLDERLDFKAVRRIGEDIVQRHCEQNGVGFSFHAVQTAEQLEALLRAIWLDAVDPSIKALPLIHLDTHGTRDGITLTPSGERISWMNLHEQLRHINRATANRLLVILSSCQGENAFREPIPLSRTAPFWGLVCARGEPSGGEVHDRLRSFYEKLLENLDFASAEPELGSTFSAFSTEELLIRAVAGHFVRNRMGRGKQAWFEELVSRCKERHAMTGHVPPLSALRPMIKQFVTPERFDLDRYRRSFLLADDPRNHGRYAWTLDDLVRLVRELPA